MVVGKSAVGPHPKFYRFVDSLKKLEAQLDRIRFDSRNSRPETLGPPARDESARALMKIVALRVLRANFGFQPAELLAANVHNALLHLQRPAHEQ